MGHLYLTGGKVGKVFRLFKWPPSKKVQIKALLYNNLESGIFCYIFVHFESKSGM